MTEVVALREREYKGWRAWSISREPLELILVPQVGGRIMGLLWRGIDLFFTQPEREGAVVELSPSGDVRDQKHSLGFPLWGGDKTWIAPQSRWVDATPYLDLDSGPYELEILAHDAALVEIRMTSRVCRESGLRVRRTVMVAADETDFRVLHEIENASNDSVDAGIWDVAMALSPGVVYLPTWQHSAFAEGVKAYESEGQSKLLRDEVVSATGSCAQVRCNGRVAFKFGVDGPEGWIAAVLDRPDGTLVGYRKSVPVYPERAYAHECVAEVYKSADYDYLEMELHGPLVRLQPGERFAIEERQSVADVATWPRSETEVRAIARA